MSISPWKIKTFRWTLTQLGHRTPDGALLYRGKSGKFAERFRVSMAFPTWKRWKPLHRRGKGFGFQELEFGGEPCRILLKRPRQDQRQ
jgi:hypothetical protein